ncbi:unnamed protein product [Peronospora destructor]|uniref:Uncharacterized protein n=1 Tax=Peronospora destructor TaxID=86335 RepID=A0AAV0T1P7_9STRA|nr:unnamed protein product [Peronospora destructor]
MIVGGRAENSAPIGPDVSPELSHIRHSEGAGRCIGTAANRNGNAYTPSTDVRLHASFEFRFRVGHRGLSEDVERPGSRHNYSRLLAEIPADPEGRKWLPRNCPRLYDPQKKKLLDCSEIANPIGDDEIVMVGELWDAVDTMVGTEAGGGVGVDDSRASEVMAEKMQKTRGYVMHGSAVTG